VIQVTPYWPVHNLYSLYYRVRIDTHLRALVMEQEKSSLDQFSLSLSSGRKSLRESPKKVSTDPFVVLVCTSFTCRNNRGPHRIHSGSWNEWMAEAGISITGTVSFPDVMGHKLFYLDYPVESIEDISFEKMERTCACNAEYHESIGLIRDILDGNGTPAALSELLSALSVSPGDSVLQEFLSRMDIDANAQTGPARSDTGTATTVDAILSMVDVQDTKPHQAETSVEALLAAVVDESRGTKYREEFEREIDRLTEAVTKRTRLVCSLELVRRVRATLAALFALAKGIGREPGVQLYAVSIDEDDPVTSFRDAVDRCASQGRVPDAVLWDLPVGLTPADIRRVTDVCSLCDTIKAHCFVSLDEGGDLDDALAARNDLLPVMQDQRMVLLDNLRKNPASRTLSLCVPRVSCVMRKNESLPLGGAWRALESYVSRLCDGQPVDDDRFGPDNLFRCAHTVSVENAQACTRGGVTIVCPGSEGCVTAVDPEIVSDQFLSVAYNLCVNRLVRLGAHWCAGHRSSGGDEQVRAMQHYLFEKMKRFGIFDTPDDINVTVDSSSITLSITSSHVVGKHPFVFEVSF